MKTILKVLIDTDGANCGKQCRFLDSVVSSCTLFGGLDYAHSNAYARHANCVKAGVRATTNDMFRTVDGRGQLVRVNRG